MSFLDKLSERADNMGSKQIAILFIVLIFILALFITGLYFVTKKEPKKIDSTEAETEQIDVKKELKSPIKPLPEPIKENKVDTSTEETKPISIEDAKKLNAEIMSDPNVPKPNGPLDELDKLIKEDEKRTSSPKKQEIKSNDKQESPLKDDKSETKKNTKSSPTLPINNPYNIGKKEDLGVMVDAIKMWNEEQIKDYEETKKKATKSK